MRNSGQGIGTAEHCVVRQQGIIVTERGVRGYYAVFWTGGQGGWI